MFFCFLFASLVLSFFRWKQVWVKTNNVIVLNIKVLFTFNFVDIRRRRIALTICMLLLLLLLLCHISLWLASSSTITISFCWCSCSYAACFIGDTCVGVSVGVGVGVVGCGACVVVDRSLAISADCWFHTELLYSVLCVYACFCVGFHVIFSCLTEYMTRFASQRVLSLNLKIFK